MAFEKEFAAAVLQRARDFKKTSQGFQLSGLRNADLFEDTHLVQDMRPEPRRRAPQKSSVSMLGNLMADAQKGHENFISPGQLEENRRKKEEYERSRQHARHTPGLPSLQDLQRLQNAIRDGKAFMGDSYRPDYRNTHSDPFTATHTRRSRHPYPDTPPPHIPTAHHLEMFLPSKSKRTSCQVSLCTHEHYAIDWESSDPDNEKGSWIARLRHYWDDSSSQEDHKKCQRTNDISRCKILVERIIASFMRKQAEDKHNLSDRNERIGLKTRSPPSFEKVLREVRIMYSHLFRGRYEDVVEKKEEALRKEQDRATHLDNLAEETHKQAQRERRRKGVSKEPNVGDRKADVLSISKPTKKRNRAEDDEDYLAHQEVPQKKRKTSTPLGNHFEPTNMEERKQRAAALAKKLTAESATKAQGLSEPREKAESSWQLKTMPGDLEEDLDEETPVTIKETVSEAPGPKTEPKNIHVSAPVIEDSDEETDYVLPYISTKLPETQIHGEFEKEAEAIVEDVVHHQEELAKQREEQIATTGEKVAVFGMSEDGEMSDTNLTESHDETISSVAQSGVENTASPASSCTSSSASKRRYSLTTEDEEDDDSRSSSTSPRPLKKLKTKTVIFSPDTISPAVRKRSMSPPYIRDTNEETAGQNDGVTSDEGNEKVKTVNFSPDTISPVVRKRSMSPPYVRNEEADDMKEAGESDDSSDGMFSGFEDVGSPDPWADLFEEYKA
ncbi:hypothetical protein NX059_002094 [Plenodomus lindquistii]|nr:hypothetical protein NX059_002094 [Plenodomus lindquistii]